MPTDWCAARTMSDNTIAIDISCCLTYFVQIPNWVLTYSAGMEYELFFKQMKLTLDLQQTTVWSNRHRLAREVPGNLYRCPVYCPFCCSCARAYAWRQMQREVSFDKTVKHFRRHVAPLVDILYSHAPDRLHAHLIAHLHGILRYGIKERQKSRMNSLDEVIQPGRYRDYRILSVPLNSTPRMIGLETLAA